MTTAKNERPGEGEQIILGYDNAPPCPVCGNPNSSREPTCWRAKCKKQAWKLKAPR